MSADNIVTELDKAKNKIKALKDQLALEATTAVKNRKAADLYRNILETTNAVAWELDIESRVFTYMAPQIEELSGYPPEVWVNLESWSERIHPEDRSEAVMWCQAETAKGVDHVIEYRMLHANGGAVWVRDVISVILEDNKPTLLRGHFFNIDDRKAAEEEAMNRTLEAAMLRRQKLESLGVVASGIAHDFNNLLAGILGNIELCMAMSPPDSRLLTPLRDARKAGDQAADLICQLLAYTGKEQLTLNSVDLNTLLEEVWRLLESARSKQIQLIRNFDEHLPEVFVDASLFRQIVLNLVINGSDSIGMNHGSIVISTRQTNGAEVRLHDPNVDIASQFVVVEVSDTGGGISETDLPKIFDPFFTTKASGRGLGLAAVQGIVTRHNGYIAVDSQVGEGTSFRIFLPTNQPKKALPCEPTMQENVASDLSGCILVVDDEEVVRNMASNLLDYCGFSVLAASNGKEALQVYREHGSDIDCVLLDMRMPIMSGEETLKNLRQIDNKVRVVLASGYHDTSVRNDDACTFVQKPYSREQLIKAIEDASLETSATSCDPR